MNSVHSVLIVEDEILSAIVLEKQLRKAGLRTAKRVTTGEDAVNFFEQSCADAVLMDICLAGEMDGIEAAARIQEHSESRIIFMTGYQDSATRRRAEALAPAGFFVKPVGAADLLPALGVDGGR